MSQAPLPLRDALKSLLTEERAALTSHPDLPELLAYQDGTLPPRQAERLREHLALCAECSARLLDLGRFLTAEPPAGDEPLGEDDVAAAWQKMKRRLPAPLRRDRRAHLALPLAASLLAATTLLAGWWMISLQRPDLRNPQVLNLELSPSQSRGKEKPLKARAALPLQLLLHRVPPVGAPLYAKVRRQKDGGIAWTGEETPRGSDPLDLGTLPARKLRRGVYQIEIREGKAHRRLDLFSLHVD